MKSNELRIGNLTKQGEVKNFFESGVHVGYGKTYSFNELEPIPLTEEWLIKFGFEKAGRFFTTENNLFIWKSRTNNFTFRTSYHEDIEVNSIHQLQNLYFALTNEELKIK